MQNDYSDVPIIDTNKLLEANLSDKQIHINPQLLLSWGFNLTEIKALHYIITHGGKVTVAALMSYGLSSEVSKKLKYMYDLTTEKVEIDTKEDLRKHLRKMFGAQKRIGIGDLPLSKVNKIPRKAVIAGIRDKKYSIYNSCKYPVNERLYNVVDVNSSKIIIWTVRRPILKYKESKCIHGVIEIKEVKPKGILIIAVNKKYIRLVNRFLIIASLRKPALHNSMIEVLCIEGCQIYVYAQTMKGTGEYAKYNNSNSRIYGFGFMPEEIQPKLMKVVSELYKIVRGVQTEFYPANCDYKIIEPEEKAEKSEVEE